jgi:hypothetical protein
MAFDLDQYASYGRQGAKSATGYLKSKASNRSKCTSRHKRRERKSQIRRAFPRYQLKNISRPSHNHDRFISCFHLLIQTGWLLFTNPALPQLLLPSIQHAQYFRPPPFLHNAAAPGPAPRLDLAERVLERSPMSRGGWAGVGGFTVPAIEKAELEPLHSAVEGVGRWGGGCA